MPEYSAGQVRQLMNRDLQKFSKARKVWRTFGKILGRDRADVRTSVMFYKAVFQDVILYG